MFHHAFVVGDGSSEKNAGARMEGETLVREGFSADYGSIVKGARRGAHDASNK